MLRLYNINSFHYSLQKEQALWYSGVQQRCIFKILFNYFQSEGKGGRKRGRETGPFGLQAGTQSVEPHQTGLQKYVEGGKNNPEDELGFFFQEGTQANTGAGKLNRNPWRKDTPPQRRCLLKIKIRIVPKCPSVNEWIKKLWYIYTMEFYAAERKKELLHFATA